MVSSGFLEVTFHDPEVSCPRTAEVAVCSSTCVPFPVTPGSVMDMKKGKYKNIPVSAETPSGHFAEPHPWHFPGAGWLRESWTFYCWRWSYCHIERTIYRTNL